MEPEKSAVDEFFDDLKDEDKQKADIFAEEKKDETPPEKGDADEDSDKESEPRKNRRHRRLEAALERERASAIALNERVMELSQALAERGSAQDLDTSEPPAEWIALYGDTPQARQAWKVNETYLRRFADEAREAAVAEFENRRAQEIEQEREFEQVIDSELESLEDEYDVDLTSNSPAARKARREFLTLVQELSPKDDNGIVTGYADFNAAWEMYQLKRGSNKSPEMVAKAKDLSARSMEKSGSAAPPEKRPTPGFRGWMKDFPGLLNN